MYAYSEADYDREKVEDPRQLNIEEVNLHKGKFTQHYEDILRDFELDMPQSILQKKYDINRQVYHYWKTHFMAILDFGRAPVPKLIQKREKEILQKYVDIPMMAAKSKSDLTAKQIIEVQRKKKNDKFKTLNQELAGLTDIRLRGLRIINMGMDKIEELIVKEKSIGQIAKVLQAVMPYVIVKAGEEGKLRKDEIPLEDRRAKFVQNVMNIYNINSNEPFKLEENDTTEDADSEWDTEEQSAGDE